MSSREDGNGAVATVTWYEWGLRGELREVEVVKETAEFIAVKWPNNGGVHRSKKDGFHRTIAEAVDARLHEQLQGLAAYRKRATEAESEIARLRATYPAEREAAEKEGSKP